MKTLIAMPFLILLAAGAHAQSRTYDSRVPLIEEDYIEIENDGFDNRLERELMEEQRMEEREERRLDREARFRRSPDGVDYTDRTRTNRERHALNTSGDASDDR